MVRAEDASKISRIVDKFELATVDTKAIRDSVLAKQSQQLNDVPVLNEDEHDRLVASLMDSMNGEKSNRENPTLARTKKKDENQFEPILEGTGPTTTKRPSVRKELNEIMERKKQTVKQRQSQNHQRPKKKKRKKER